jgi:hypothetical protein
MAAAAANLFLRLHKWAARQDENFLTESLAVVLELLLTLAPEVGVRLVSRLTGGFIDLPSDAASAIVIRTQVEAVQGRPDLEIRTPHRLAWIEVKAESELRTGQLEGYRVLLGGSGIAETRLILLTRYPEVFPAASEHPDLAVRWFNVAGWLEEEASAAKAAGEVAGFLVQQFLDFLGARTMNLTQVGKFMPEGLRDVMSMMNMLREAAAACKVSAKTSAAWNYNGLNLDGMKYWVGVDYVDPDKIWFRTRGRIYPDAARKLPIGEVTQESWVPGGYRWCRSAELNSEDVHFFARSKVSQMEWLEAFLSDCLRKARSVETPDQPPIPEEPERE